jgi:hypothetical protein
VKILDLENSSLRQWLEESGSDVKKNFKCLKSTTNSHQKSSNIIKNHHQTSNCVYMLLCPLGYLNPSSTASPKASEASTMRMEVSVPYDGRIFKAWGRA